MKRDISPMAGPLLAWYANHQRILPWRQSRDPYHIWVSEIMLQQTQVDTVIPYYERFLKQFPTVRSLARAPLHKVLKAWENLGYYGRARRLHDAAKIVTQRFSGKVPDTDLDLKDLPGVGRYTAGAILSIAYGQPVAAIDGNVRRVMCRYFGITDPVDQPATLRRLEAKVTAAIPRQCPGRFNQALMDLGALVCKKRNPACPECPLHRRCRAYAQKVQHLLPHAQRRAPIPHKRFVAAVLTDKERRVLVVQRPPAGLLASLWKFPGGPVKPKETLAEALRRTVHEELHMKITGATLLASINHAYTHFRMTLYVFLCLSRRGKPRTGSCQDWQWIAPEDLRNLAFSKADRLAIAAFLKS